MENNITLELLIQEHKNRLPYLRDVGQMFVNYEYPNMEAYHSWLAKTIRFIEIHYQGDKHIDELANGFREAINKASQSSDVKVNIGVDGAKSNGNVLYLQSPGSNDFGKVFDIIINCGAISAFSATER
jgi:hypothetical protein